MGFFDNAPPLKNQDQVNELSKAVSREDVQATSRLLEEAGGPCQVRDLVTATSRQNTEMRWWPILNGDKETIMVGDLNWSNGVKSIIPLAGIVQDRCKQ